MIDAVRGVAVIACLMCVGVALARTRAIGRDAVPALTAVVYWAATPALLFHQLAHADVAEALGIPLATAATSGITVACLTALALRLISCNRADIVLGAMSGSVTNAAHIGVPIALYVLGSGEAVAPLIIFQLAFLTPLFFTLADWVGRSRRFSPLSFAKTLATNPMVLAMAAGVACSTLTLTIPPLLDDTSRMLGEAAPPLVLIAFGASLVGQRMRLDRHTLAAITVTTLAKLVLHPLLAFGAAWTMGASARILFQVTVMAALPSAQNAFVASQRSGAGVDIARGSVAVTSIGSLIVVVALAWLFHL